MIDLSGKLHIAVQPWTYAQRDALERLHDGLWEDVAIFCEKLDPFKTPFIFDVSMNDNFPWLIEARKDTQSLTMEEFAWWGLALVEWGRKHDIVPRGFIEFEESNGNEGELQFSAYHDHELKISTLQKHYEEVDIEEYAGEIIPWNHGDFIDEERDRSKMKI